MEKLIKYNFVFCLWIFPLTTFFRYFLVYLGYNDFFLNFDYSNCCKIILIMQIFIYLYNIKKKIKKLNYFDYIIWILLIAAAVSTLFALNFNVSIFGYRKRFEGFIAISMYYLLFLNARNINRKDYELILKNIIFIGIFNFIYACLQLFTNAPFVLKFKLNWMASGLNYNPNFFGTFMCVAGLISVCLYLFNNKSKIFYFVSSIIMLVGLVMGQSIGPIIGYTVGIIILLLIIIIKKMNILKKYFKLILILIIVFFTIVYSTDYLFNNVYQYKNTDSYTIKGDIDRIMIYFGDLFGISTDNIKKKTHLLKKKNITLNEISTNRFILWEKSMPIIEDNLLVGVGLDNFGVAYNEYYDDLLYDKVHNVYLQILVTNGLIGFIPYMIWLGMIIYLGFKKTSNKIFILLIPFIGYSIQAIFNISVVDVAPIFYILGGMIVGFKEE